MALPYRQVKDLYDVLASSGVTSKSLPEWSSEMNQLTGTDLYGEGLNDNVIKRASVGLDRLIEKTGAPELGRSFGAGIGDLFGMKQQGGDIGAGLPRMFANFAPAVAAEALTAGGATPFLLGALGTGALSGAETYTSTGSAASGIISGLTNALLPKGVGNIEQGALSFLRNRGLNAGVDEALLPRLVKGAVTQGTNIGEDGTINSLGTSSVSQLFPRSLGQSAFSTLAGQGAATGILGASELASQAFSGQGMQNPFTPEFALGLGLSQLPFSALHLGGKALGLGKSPMVRADELDAAIQSTQRLLHIKEAQDQLKQQTDFSKLPPAPVEVPTEAQSKILEDTNARLAALGVRREAIKANPTPENVEELGKITTEENQTVQDLVEQTGGVGLGTTKVQPEGDTIPVLGENHFYSPNEKKGKGKGYYTITVKDDPANVGLTYPDGSPIAAGDRIRFPEGNFPSPVNADINNPQYLLPRNKFTKITDNYAAADALRAATDKKETPELPIQRLALDLEDHRRNLETLDKIEASLGTLPKPLSYGELLDHLTQINSVRSDSGYPEIDLASMMKVMKKKGIATEKDATVALLNETRSMQLAEQAAKADRLIHMQDEVNVEGAVRTQAEAGDEEAKKILSLYDELGAESGRRNVVATSGLFWQKVGEMARNGQEITADKLRSWKELTAAEGKGIKREQEIAPVPVHVFEALKSDDAVMVQKIVQLVMKKIASDSEGPNSDNARILKRLALTGDFTGTDASIEQAALDSGVAENEVEARESRELFKSQGQHEAIQGVVKQAMLENSKPSLAPKQLPAGGQVNPFSEFEQAPEGKFWYQGVGDNKSSWVTSNLEKAKQYAAKGKRTNGRINVFTPEQVGETAFADKEGNLITPEQYAATESKDTTIQTLGTEGKLPEPKFSVPLNSEVTLGDPSRAPQREPVGTPFTPTTEAETAITRSLTGDGHVLLEPLRRSVDPDTRNIVEDLIREFPEALKRITAQVVEGAGSSARALADRTVRIDFTPDVVGESASARENVVLHEVLHGLTKHELANLPEDSAIRKQFDDLRERLVSALPKSMRSYYDRAVKTNWMDRYTSDPSAEMFGELHPDDHARQILYGLLNNDEMVSQGFTSWSMKEYMQSVKGKATGWQAFTRYVKGLLKLKENVSDSAFGEFLGLTSQLTKQGEYLSSFLNYGESYFDSIGKGGAYGKTQTQRALGILGDSPFGTDRTTLAHTLAVGNGRVNPEVVAAENDLRRVFQTKGEDFMHLKNLLDEHGAEVSVTGIDDLITNAIAEKEDIHDLLDLMPEDASRYVFAKLRDHADVLRVLDSATRDSNSGLVNIARPKLISGPVKDTLKVVGGILRAEERQVDSARALVGMSNVSPDGFLTGAPSFAPKVLKEFVDDAKETGGGVMHWLANFLEPMGQLARRIPESAEILSKAFELGPNARKMFAEGVKVFGMDTSSPFLDVLSHESVKQSEKVFGNPKLLAKVDKWLWLNNKEGGDKVTMLSDGHPEVQKLLAGLSDKEKEDVHALVAKQMKSTVTTNVQKLEKMTQIAAVNGAAVALPDVGGKTKDRLALSDTLLRAVIDLNDPMKQPMAMTRLQQVQGKMSIEGFNSLLSFTQGEAEKLKLWKEYFDANPAWATAQRTERYTFQVVKNGKVKRLQASSVKEAKDIIQKSGGTLRDSIEDQWKGKEDEAFAYPNLPPEMVQRMQQLEENQLQMLGKTLSPEALEDIRRTSPITQILREATADQSIPGVSAPPRLLSQGAEDLPWMWNHISWVQKEATYWSRALLRAQARTYLLDPELAQNPELRTQLGQHFQNLLQPDPRAAQQMNRFVSTWFLGFNLATSMVNMTQPFVTHVAEMTAMSGKPIDSYRRAKNALAEIAGHHKGKGEWGSEEHNKFIQEATQDAQVGIGMYDDDAIAQEAVATNFKRAMMKNKVQSIGQKLDTAAGNYSNVALWTFKQGERINALSALLSSFDFHREQGLSYDEAKTKAYEFNRAVNFSGGRAQRPVGAFSGSGAFPRTVAMLATSLQSYVLGTTFQLTRYLQKGLFRPQGLTPHEVYSARKAAVQMLGTQLLAAGVLGLPFVSGAVALLDKAFPDLEINRHLREGMNSFVGGDNEQGSVLQDIAMTGVPSMLGWDLQSRLSMGNTLPGVSEINGFQPETLMGPATRIVTNFVNGVTGWAKGDAKAGMNFMPPSVAKVVTQAQSFLTDGGAIRDYQGRPLSSPTLGEQVGQGIGFQPKRLSDQNAASRILAQSTEVVNRQESQERTKMAEEVLKGNFGTVSAQLRARTTSDKDYNPVDAVRAVARAAEELTFPRDLRREGSNKSAGIRSSFLSSYSNLPPDSPSEVQRLQFRQGIEAKLGLRATSGEELRLAQLMDQLKLAQPGATRSELRAIAASTLRRAGAQTQLLPQESQ